MGKYYDESRTKLELELDRENAENTEHYIRMLENRIHEYLVVREELLTFRDSVADAVQANGLCNQGILDKVKELCAKGTSTARKMRRSLKVKMQLDDLISRKAVINITAETGALETQRRVKDLPAVTTPIPVGTDLSTLPTPGTYSCVGWSTICRAVTLLNAAKERLEMEAAHCDDAMPVTTHYDDADCDGYCLLEDIKTLLDEFNDRGVLPGME